MNRPLISVVLPVKNGLPHLRTAIDALVRQTYRQFEVVVQDGGSTDGTLDYLSSVAGLPSLTIASAPDAGVGQAYNRALQRATGDLICFAASDEQLDPQALERGVHWIERHPNAVVANGSVHLVNASARTAEYFHPPRFDLLGHLACEIVLAFAGLANRTRIGDDLYYDESLKTCPDYDFWIRLGSRFDPRDFVAVQEPFKTARADAASMTYRPEVYDQFCRDKLFVLNRFLDGQSPGPLVVAVRRAATFGIYAWAAESVFTLQGGSSAFVHWCREAAAIEPWSPRLATLAASSAAFTIDEQTGDFRVGPLPQPDEPEGETVSAPYRLDVRDMAALPVWTDKGAAIERGATIRVQTPEGPWEYAAEIPLTLPASLDPRSMYWARIEIQALSGEVGVSLLVDNDVFHERLIRASHGRVTVFVKISRPHARGILIRNGGQRAASVADVFAASIQSCPRPAPGGTLA